MQEPVGDGNRKGKTEGILKSPSCYSQTVAGNLDNHNEQPVKLDNNKDKNKDKDKDMDIEKTLKLLQAIQTIITSSQWKEAMRSSKAIPGRLGTQVLLKEKCLLNVVIFPRGP